MAVAWAQLIFNVVMTLAVLLLLRVFRRRLESFDADAARPASLAA
jgi:Na+/phosphate symporter